MRDKYINVIIQNLINNSDYAVIEINGQGHIPNAWCAKASRFGSDKYLIFLDKEHVEYANEYKRIILSNTKMSNIPIEIITVLITYRGDTYWQEEAAVNESLYDNFIVIDSYNNEVINNRVASNDNDVYTDLQQAIKRAQLEKRHLKDKIQFKDSKITLSLIALNIVVYIITIYLNLKWGNGSFLDMDAGVLVLMGAKYNPLISSGQYFRLITCMFLHGGLMHIAFNMYALNAIGPLVERVYGKSKFLIIYFTAGICSSLLSYKFSNAISVGASGAIFGLLGAVLVFGFKMKNSIGKQFMNSILQVIAINIFIGLALPNIDNFGHMGGLLGGLVVSMVFMESISKKIKS